jgi:hypothetical protein
MIRSLVVLALFLAAATAGCANPYCGAIGEPCCGVECAPTLECIGQRCAIPVPCDPTAGLGCPPGESCVRGSSDGFFCGVQGGNGVDTTCRFPDDCALGLVCARRESFGSVSGRCETLCGPSNECPTQHVCSYDRLGRASCLLSGSSP